MIRKTPEFDKKFNSDISNLLKRYRFFNIKGSYLLERSNRHANNFMFLQLSCGFKNEFQPPWTIGRHGSCNFSLEFARKWFSNFKKLNKTTNLVPEDVISFIDSIFKKDTLRIGDIVEIENILYPFAEIIWSQQDIAIGYKIINGQHYSLSSIITKE